MTDDPLAPAPDPLPAPGQVEVSDAWLAANAAKRLAYEEGRRRHVRAWHRTGEPDTEAAETAPDVRVRTPRGRIHDKRQASLDL